MITLSLTNFNRYEMLFESFAQVLDDPRISEVVISDDCSDYGLYKKIQDRIRGIEKIKLYRNDTNIDCYRNKRKAVSLAKNEWVVLLDSDNIIDKSYLDAIFVFTINGVQSWQANHIYTPGFAKPHFDFRAYAGPVNHKTVSNKMLMPMFETMLNACNYLVNRDEYLRVWDSSVDPVTSDSIYMAYKWLEAGNYIYVVEGMQYQHRVNDHKEEKSHYAKNVKRTPKGFHNEVVAKLKAMR